MNAPGLLDAALVAAARGGDETAFAELYRRHAGYVKSIGRGMLRRPDVDDMCQDTFLLAFTRLDGFEGQAQFRSWITRIAINECLVALRKSRQPSNGESHLMQLEDEMAGATLDRQLEGVATRVDLERLLRALKPQQRRILEMAYLEEVPDLEIAERLGITLTAVKSRLCYAKRQIHRFHKKP